MTLGQQRLNAFQYASNLIAQHLVSSTEIKVDASMIPLGGSQYSAVLGQAGPISVVRDFTGAPVSNTYYPIALAEALYGADLNAGNDIVAEFNTDIDTSTVLGSTSWYYGFNLGGGSNVDFVTVVNHELIHGLGFLNLLNQSGQKYNGRNDTYLLKLEGHGYSPSAMSSMTDGQRATAVIDEGNLHWIGAQVVANSGGLTGGKDVNDHVFMYAPSSFSSGSSVSHFSTSLSPSETMEPFYSGPKHKPGLAVHLLKDIGWTTTVGSGSANLQVSISDTGLTTLNANNTYTATVTNNGSDTAMATMLTYMIPFGHSYVSATPSAGSCTFKNRIVSCDLGNLANAGSATVNVVTTLKASGSHTHAAIVSSATSDPNLSDNRVFKTTTVSGTIDTSLSLGSFTVNGSQLTQTADVTNNGPSAATNLVVEFSLPSGLSFVGSGSGSCCSANGSSVKCHVAELADQQSTSVSVTLSNSNSNILSSNVTVSQNQLDANSTNNTANVEIAASSKTATSEDSCFIATAAFGSLLEKEVKWLRRFRDIYLLTNQAGKQFVSFYYQTSPPIANFIRQNEVLRAIMRGSLGPVVALSRWLLAEPREEMTE